MNDLTNRRFGHLLCLEPLPADGPAGTRQWRCRCDCGGEIRVRESLLLCGVVVSCGCTPARGKNLEGRTFGRLRALDPLPVRDKDGSIRWLCRCACGEYAIVSSHRLLTGTTTSCGCYQAETRGSNRTFVGGTCIEIIASRKLVANNHSGFAGVSKCRNRKWQSKINYAGKQYYLGRYDQLEDAVAIRRAAEKLRLDDAKSRLAEAAGASACPRRDFAAMLRELLAARRKE